MRRPNASLLTFILSFTAVAAAQQSPLPTTYVQTQSTGMIGMIGTQAARLSAVNLAAAGSASCSAHIAFLDDQGVVLKSGDITVEPGKSAYVDFTPSAAGRQQFRVTIGITRSVALAPTTGSGIAMPVFFCSLVPTLEILDAPGSKTDLVVSDFRYVSSPIVMGALTGAPVMR